MNALASPRRSVGRATLRRRALILGDSRAPLTAARDLGSAGWMVGVGAPGRGTMATASRHVRHWHRVPKPAGDLGTFTAAITDAVRAAGYTVAFAADDDYLGALSAARHDLDLCVPYAPHESVVTTLDKVTLEDAARRAGLGTPCTTPATNHALADWRGPAIVKNRTHWIPGRTDPAHRLEAELLTDHEAIVRRVEQLRAIGGDPVLQVPLEGRLLCYGVLRDRQGRFRGRIQQTSDHVWPTPAGRTARAVTMPIDPALSARVHALLDDLQWFGMVNLQLFLGADGRYSLIDFNGRFNHSLQLALSAGLRFPLVWAQLALGLEPTPLPDAPPGARFSWLEGDLARAVRERRGGLWHDVSDTLRFAAVARHPVISVRDPLPMVRKGQSLLSQAADAVRARSQRPA